MTLSYVLRIARFTAQVLEEKYKEEKAQLDRREANLAMIASRQATKVSLVFPLRLESGFPARSKSLSLAAK
jgi:hypothetical protein